MYYVGVHFKYYNTSMYVYSIPEHRQYSWRIPGHISCDIPKQRKSYKLCQPTSNIITADLVINFLYG